jgi:hypothetical protein
LSDNTNIYNKSIGDKKMIKKVFLGALLLGLTGLLIFGAINRTIAKTDTPLARGDGSGSQLEGSISTDHQVAQGNSGRGRSEANAATGALETHEHDEGECSEEGSSSHGQGSSSSGQRRGGQGAGNVASSAEHSEAEMASLLTFEGTVSSADAEILLVTSADGEYVEVEGRTWRYALEQGFTVNQNDLITLVGFFEDGEFKVIQIIKLNDSGEIVDSFELRELSGRPMWAGGGQQGGEL